MKLKSTLRVLTVLLFFMTLTPLAQASTIVAAMREYQARFYFLNGYYLQMPNCPCGCPAPAFPSDDFYGDLDKDPQEAAVLVQFLTGLFYNVALYGNFVNTADGTTGISGRSSPLMYMTSDFPSVFGSTDYKITANINAANYPGWFDTLQSYILDLQYVWAASLQNGPADTNCNDYEQYLGIGTTPALAAAGADGYAYDSGNGKWGTSTPVGGTGWEADLPVGTYPSPTCAYGGIWVTTSDEWSTYYGEYAALSQQQRGTVVADPGGYLTPATWSPGFNPITHYYGFLSGTATIFIGVTPNTDGVSGNTPPVTPDGNLYSIKSGAVSQTEALVSSPLAGSAVFTAGDNGAGWWLSSYGYVLKPNFSSTANALVLNSCSGLLATVTGGTEGGLASMAFKISMGPDGAGNNAGYFYYEADAPSANIFNGGYLNYAFSTGETPNTLNGQYYLATPTGTAYWPTASSGGYTVYFSNNAATPALVASVSVAEGTNLNDVIVTESIVGSSNEVMEFVYTTNTGTWAMIKGSGAQVDSRSTSWSTTTNRTDTVAVANGGGTVASQTTESYQLFPQGLEMTQQIVGSGAGVAKTNTWVYYQATEGASYGELKQSIAADGSWQLYEYDSEGRVTNLITGFGDNGWTTTNAGSNRQTVTSYNDAAGIVTNIEYLLGTEVGRSYEVDSLDTVYNVEEIQTITCTHASKPIGDPSNLTNIVWRTTVATGAMNAWDTMTNLNADGTMSIYSYNWVPVGGGLYGRAVMVTNGAPNAGQTAIVDGTITMTTYGAWNEILTNQTVDIVSAITLSEDTYVYTDSEHQSYVVTHLDGTTEGAYYSTYGLQTATNRDGVITQYYYDGSQRQVASMALGIMTSNVLDAAGNVLGTYRVGTDASVIPQRTMGYDSAGFLISETNALGGVTSHSWSFDTAGEPIYTDTDPDSGTVVRTNYVDGTQAGIGGTAGHKVRNFYGVDGTGQYSIAANVSSTGGTNEWVKSYSDVAGRPLETVYGDGSTGYSYYNAAGQLSRSVDADGVDTMYQYNDKGEQTIQAVDMNGNGTIDPGGSDRMTFTTNDVTTDYSTGVHRTRTYVWMTASVGSSNLVSMTETAVNGLTTWQTRYGPSSSVTTETSTTYSGGTRTTTSTAADGSSVVTVFTNGVEQSVTQYNNTPSQIGGTTYAYDAHGRAASSTDARNGTTSFVYNNADQIGTNTTPSPGGGLAALTTVTSYDSSLRPTTVVAPDGGTVTTSYYPDGSVEETSGARVYPVEYTYDPQGRKLTMTTWTNFPSSGSAVTTWNYDSQRGWLNSKSYADGHGPSYTYTPAGRLKTRAWARGVTTTYTTNAAGDVASISYSDSTPGVTYTYDREGRLSTAVCNGTTATRSYDMANDVLSESSSGGILNGLAVDYTYDSLLRRTNMAVLNGATVLSHTTNSYDGAGRISVVGDGTNTATYTYLANSPLVDHIVFANSGTGVMTTRYTNDYVNRLTGISSVLNYAYGYNTASQRTSITNVDGTVWNYQYDSLGQVTNGVKHWGNGNVVAGQQFGYGFDNIGNRTMTLAGGDKSGNNRRQASYAANNLNQYTSRTVPGDVDVIGNVTNTATVWVDQIAAYQTNSYFWQAAPVANTSSPQFQTVTTLAALPNGSSPEYGVTNIGHVFVPETPESYSYDYDGNLTQDGRWTYTWDGENRLIGMTSPSGAPTPSKYSLSFAYDYQGRRIQKQVSTNSGSGYVAQYTNDFVYDGWNLEATLNPGSLINSFVWGLDLSGSIQGAGGVGGLAIENIVSNGVQFPAYDGNGNVTALANTSGTVTATYEYGPFGEVIRETGPVVKLNPFRFSTKYQDDESDFLYYGYRYYNPSAGRWLSRDPLGDEVFFRRYARSHMHSIRGLLKARRDPVYVLSMNDAAGKIDPRGLNVYKVSLPSSVSGSVVDHREIIGDDGNGGCYVLEFYPKKGSGCHLFGATLFGKGTVDYTHRNTTASAYITDNGFAIMDTVDTDYVLFYPSDESVDAELNEDAAKWGTADPPNYILLLNDCGSFANDWLKHASEVLQEAEDSWPDPWDPSNF